MTLAIARVILALVTVRNLTRVYIHDIITEGTNMYGGGVQSLASWMISVTSGQPLIVNKNP